MAERVAIFLVCALYLYALVGSIFGVAFVLRGVERIDSQAKGSSLGFRLLIFPGTVAFWPVFLRRWIAGQSEPPEERNPHS